MALEKFEERRVHCWCEDVEVWIGPGNGLKHYCEIAPGDNENQLAMLEWVLFNAEYNWAWDTQGVNRDNWTFYFERESDKMTFILRWR